jgi:hypothetical protein
MLLASKSPYFVAVIKETGNLRIERVMTDNGSSIDQKHFRKPVNGSPFVRSSLGHHSEDLIVVDSSRSAGASFVEQTFAAILQNSTTPLANCVLLRASSRTCSRVSRRLLKSGGRFVISGDQQLSRQGNDQHLSNSATILVLKADSMRKLAPKQSGLDANEAA